MVSYSCYLIYNTSFAASEIKCKFVWLVRILLVAMTMNNYNETLDATLRRLGANNVH